MADKAEKITNIATKRGFFYPSGEIYAVKSGFWTYGHLGTLLKQKFENLWRSFFLSLSPNYYEIDDVNILSKEVFESSGHLENFKDPLVECKKCHLRFKADEIIEGKTGREVGGFNEIELDKIIKKEDIHCPECNSELNQVKFFNMMFELRVGSTGKDIMYLRPETAQSPYLSFKREFQALREKLPLGLAVIGKAFRNEISPRQGFFRLREFTQAELQIFINPDKFDEAEDWDEIKDYKIKIDKEVTCKEANSKLEIPKFYVYHMAKIQQFYLNELEIPKEKFKFRKLSEKEKAFYNKIHYDIELNLETLNGWKEVAGLHYRGEHDLGGHQKGSKTKLEVTIDNKKFIPNVLELSFGVDRNLWALLDNFYKEEKERTLFTFPYKVSPIDIAIFPLIRKDNLPKLAKEIFHDLRHNFTTTYDETGSIGRMYRRVDEIGCPFMITVDHDSIKNKDVTIRERETMQQIRVKIKDLKDILTKLLNKEIEFKKVK
ncbi:MAG: glycine--tRNA ligase [Nanoarchaeota archaeon]|nr:glycine--tRNA ligase [Nanoarchaeota archaeon]